jgi:GNAT superfamily N-acetyltransferase
MEFIVRSCHEKDLPALVALCENHAAYERAQYESFGKLKLLKDALFGEKPKLFCLIVESKQHAVGYASYTFDFSTWNAASFLHLDCLYLEPDYRNFGIGELLISSLRDIAKQNNCSDVQWQTPTFNQRAINFYHRIGANGKEKIRFSLTV